VVEIAELLGASPGFVRLEAERGKLRIIKKGGRLLVLAKDVQRYLSRDDRDAPKAIRVKESKTARRTRDQAEIRTV
jgi:excisionase family DNA binding protein